MAWMLWLAAPVVATTVAAVLAWWAGWRARPAARVDPLSAMRDHRAFLDALVVPARGTARVSPPSLDAVPAEITPAG